MSDTTHTPEGKFLPCDPNAVAVALCPSRRDNYPAPSQQKADENPP